MTTNFTKHPNEITKEEYGNLLIKAESKLVEAWQDIQKLKRENESLQLALNHARNEADKLKLKYKY